MNDIDGDSASLGDTEGDEEGTADGGPDDAGHSSGSANHWRPAGFMFLSQGQRGATPLLVTPARAAKSSCGELRRFLPSFSRQKSKRGGYPPVVSKYENG